MIRKVDFKRGHAGRVLEQEDAMHAADSASVREMLSELVHPATVEALLDAQNPENDPAPLDAASWEILTTEVPADSRIPRDDALRRAMRIAQVAAAERLVRLLGTVSRHAAARNAHCRETVVGCLQAGAPRFTETVVEGLVDRFGLFDCKPRSPTELAVALLAHDLYRWVDGHRAASEQIGLRLDESGALQMRCPDRTITRGPHRRAV